MRVPTATYRLQFNAGFRFSDARALIPYLRDLDVTDLYASPIFAARRGSVHGYDIIDPTQLNPELGPDAEFRALVEELQRNGMGLLLDIVPNHMAATPENPWWADVLEHGEASRYARFFDIDWERSNGKVLLPILGKPLDEVLEAGEISVAVGEQPLRIRYGASSWPIAPDSYPLAERLAAEDRPDLRSLLEAQAYRLAYWKTGMREITYRRFFDINDLVGIRVEDPEVFEATHAAVFELVRKASVTGLRIDHVDGLSDPAGYLERLQRRLAETAPGTGAGGDFYVVVEKILTGDEEIPDEWPVAGTTGYDFLNTLNGLFVDARGLETLGRTYAGFTGSDATLLDVTYERKKRVARELFSAELAALVEELGRLTMPDGAGGIARNDLEQALVEVSACLPVYRTYLRGDSASKTDRDYIERALGEAARRHPDLHRGALELLRGILQLEETAAFPEEQRDARLRFVMRWQQFTGPLAAKGFEDTALYVYNPLISTNEVGSDPETSGAISVDEFHRHNVERLRRWPQTLNGTATHDTKRGEDARARINVLSEMPDEWAACVRRWAEWNAGKKLELGKRLAPDPNDELLLYQTLVGAWPLDEAELTGFPQRIREYAIKAAREAKTHTDWLDPDREYEGALTQFVDALLAGGEGDRFLADFRRFQERVAYYGALNSLAQLVLKIASPGIPDFYRGTELWDLSLVDPDNRRAVDYARRQRALATLVSEESADLVPVVRDLLDRWRDGTIKLYVTMKALRIRRSQSELLREGEYLPVVVEGRNADHVVALARRRQGSWVIAAAPRLVTGVADASQARLATAAWDDTSLVLPSTAPQRWSNVFTGDELESVPQRGGRQALSLNSAFAVAPVALLEGLVEERS